MQRMCDVCGAPYQAKREHSRYCSTRCRNRAARRGTSDKPAPVVLRAVEPVEGMGPIEAATVAELAAVGQQNTATGLRAVNLARLIDSPPPMTYSSVAGWSREHASALAAAVGNAEKPAARSPLDLARERRNAKHA